MVALDAAGTASYFNTPMQRLLNVVRSRRIVNIHAAAVKLRRDGRALEALETPLYRALRGEIVEAEAFDFELPAGKKISTVAFAAPLRETDGSIYGAIATFLDLDKLETVERRSAARLIYLVEAGQALSGSLSGETIFSSLCPVLLPNLGDFFLMMLVNSENRPSVVAMKHADPVKNEAITRLTTKLELAPQSFRTPMRVLSSGRAEMIADMRTLLERNDVRDRYREFVRALLETGGLRACVAVPMKNHNEVVGAIVLCTSGSYQYEDLTLLEEIGRRAAAAWQNANLFAHHEYASNALQEALLPAKLPNSQNVAFDAVYEPGDDRALIGGDWYDAFDLPDGKIVVSIGDVTGRGATAAALMGKVRQTISGLSYYETDPVKLLDVAEMAVMRTRPDSVITALAGVLDPAGGDFTFATAGHPLPFLRRADGRVFMLPCHGLPIGLRAYDGDRSSVTLRLFSGDALLLYTDGLTEVAHDPVAGEAHVREALERMPPERSDGARYIKEMILADGSRDDVAMLWVCYTGARDRAMPTPAPLAIKFNSRDARMAHDVRELLTQFLKAYGEETADYTSAELVIGELLGNAVRHASGPIEIELRWTQGYAELTMRDSGSAYDPGLAYPEDPWVETGRGLFIVGLLARAFHVARAYGVNETRAELDVALAA